MALQPNPIVLTSGRPVLLANLAANGTTQSFSTIVDSFRYENLWVQATVTGAPTTATTATVAVNASLDGGVTSFPLATALSLSGTTAAGGPISILGLAGAQLSLVVSALTLGTGATGINVWVGIG